MVGGAGEGGGEGGFGGGEGVGFGVGGGFELGEEAGEFFGGGFEAGDVFFHQGVHGESGAGELLGDVVDARFELGGEFFEGAEVVFGGFGDAVESGGDDAELVGGFGGGAGEGGDLVLAFGEVGVGAAGVVGEERDDEQSGAEDDAGGDGDDGSGGERGLAAVGDEDRGGDEQEIADDEGEFGQFRGLFVVIHGGASATGVLCGAGGGFSRRKAAVAVFQKAGAKTRDSDAATGNNYPIRLVVSGGGGGWRGNFFEGLPGGRRGISWGN